MSFTSKTSFPYQTSLAVPAQQDAQPFVEMTATA
jgi:hypothetical protein